jgi:penicillin-binding protein 1A
MASRRRFIPRLRGSDGDAEGGGDARWKRRARTREARIALADRADDVTDLAPVDQRNGSGNGGPPRPPTTEDSDRQRKPRLKKLRMLIVIFGLSILAFVSWIFGIMMAVSQDLPNLENRAQYDAAQNSVVLDINGERLATLTNNEGRILIESADISPSVKQAVVAIEDQRFYEHRGVDFQGIGRAIYQDILSGSAQQGASTITQQFVKNALEAQDSRTIFQKLREAALAYHIERQWSKDKIMTEYLNSIYFGEGAYGIEAAAKTYFGSEHPGCGQQNEEACASQLLPWESAMLAGIIASPSAYSPRANPEDSLARRNQVLTNMEAQGYITATELQEYQQQPIPTAKDILPPQEDSEAPYFTSWLRQQLVDKYGAGQAFGGGLEVTSTLDLELQREIEGIVASRLAGIEPTASIVVLDNETAQVRAMVGGPDYEKSPFNLATNGRRQPGSSFKPFTLVTALSQGRSPDEVFESAPQEIPFTVRFQNKDGKTKKVPELFEVNNYDDSYVGSVSLAGGTTISDNSVYAQVGTQVGPQNVAATAKKLGIDTDLSTDSEYSIQGGPYEPYNPAIILGGLTTGVTPLEMAHAYNTLAMDGQRVSGTLAANPGGPVGIDSVTDSEGNQVETIDGIEGKDHATYDQVIEPEVATTATGILETVVESGTGENAATEEPTFGKTGTTDDNGDAWFCGATDELTACIWVGHADSNTPMETEFAGQPVDGGTFPALIFHDIVLSWEELQAARKAESDAGEEELVPETTYTPTSTVPTTTTPPATTPPAEPVTPEEPAPQEPPVTDDPTGGGVGRRGH